MTIIETIQESMKKFDEEFKELVRLIKRVEERKCELALDLRKGLSGTESKFAIDNLSEQANIKFDQIKASFKSTTISILKAEIERAEGEKKENPEEHKDGDVRCESCKANYAYNICLSDLIAHYKTLIGELTQQK